MKKTLTEVNTEYLELISEVEMSEGELTPEMEERLTINEGQLVSKGIAYIEVINDRKSFISRVDEEIKRLQALKKRANNTKDYLEYNLLNAVKLHGDITTEFQKITTRKSERVEVESVNALPGEYKVVKIVESADKVKIKADLKAGKIIEGAEIVEHINLKIN